MCTLKFVFTRIPERDWLSSWEKWVVMNEPLISTEDKQISPAFQTFRRSYSVETGGRFGVKGGGGEGRLHLQFVFFFRRVDKI